MSEEVKLIAEVLWKFHNDRLEDPSINEMKPYIEPILESNRQVLQRIIDRIEKLKKPIPNKWGADNLRRPAIVSRNETIDTITAQIKKEMEK